MSKIAALKKRSKSNISNLQNALEKTQGGGFQKDERLWSLKPDTAGNGSAVIRFLPAPEGEPAPFVRIYKFGFKGKGGWYINNSPNTIGLPDPVSEYNQEMWAAAGEDREDPNKVDVRKRPRKERYLVNVLVISDSAFPENNGKVFLYDMPKSIFAMITEAIKPEFVGEEPVDVFDLFNGCDFKLKSYKKGGWITFDKSSFTSPKAITLDGKVLSDDELETIYTSLNSLQAEVAPDKFKSYDELSKQFAGVMGLSNKVATKTAADDLDEEDELPFKTDSDSKPKKASKMITVDDSDDDDLDFLDGLDD